MCIDPTSFIASSSEAKCFDFASLDTLGIAHPEL